MAGQVKRYEVYMVDSDMVYVVRGMVYTVVSYCVGDAMARIKKYQKYKDNNPYFFLNLFKSLLSFHVYLNWTIIYMVSVIQGDILCLSVSVQSLLSFMCTQNSVLSVFSSNGFADSRRYIYVFSYRDPFLHRPGILLLVLNFSFQKSIYQHRAHD